jgi:putative phosphoesterase
MQQKPLAANGGDSMKILAMADTHLESGLPGFLLDLLKGADLIVHAGDFSEFEVYSELGELGKLLAVAGNSDSPDLLSILPQRAVAKVAGVRVGVVHEAAHAFDSPGPALLAREMEVDILIYGHLHRPKVEKVAGRLLICPGSPCRPRMSAPAVAEIEIKDGSVSGRIVPVGEPVCDYLRIAGSL